MSLAKLPTELDRFIISYLRQDQKGGLYAMSRVSKYWHSLAEAILYNDIIFHANCHRQISCLCLSLIERPDLATLIQSFTLTWLSGSHLRSAPTTAENFVFWNKTAIVKSTIENIVKGWNSRLLLRWLARILAGQPCIDGAIAVILCLATNLEHIHLEPDDNGKDDLPITYEVLSRNWLRADASAETFPFCKLKSLHAKHHGKQTVPVLPWLHTLRTLGGYSCYPWTSSYPLQFLRHTPMASAALRVLEIRWIEIVPAHLERILCVPELRNIKELRIAGMDGKDNLGLPVYDLRIMVQVIEANLPDVEILEWAGVHMGGRSFSSFGSFKGLSKLRELKVDVQLLTPVHEEILSHLTHPGEYLPDTLEVLHISNLREHDQRIDQIMDGVRAIHGLQAFELSLYLYKSDSRMDMRKCGLSELPKARRKFFRDRVVNMATPGVTMRVWRQEGVYSKQLLFAPGYQRPWPIWADVDGKLWQEDPTGHWKVKDES